MIVPGEWYAYNDGVVHARVLAVNAAQFDVAFLLDTGADVTTFSAADLGQLALPHRPSQARVSGVGGAAAVVAVDTTLYLPTDAGRPAAVGGTFAAFTDPFALDMSVLGRDVLDNFAAVVDRPGDFVALIRGNHGYRVVS
ncbi:MAG: hypothetical protein U0746_16615 [Gemmataceae bacterium]